MSVTLYGQTLQLPAKTSASPGTSTELALTFSPGQSRLSTLQWEVIFQDGQTTLDAFRLGPAGQSAKKNLQCAGTWRVPNKVYVERCILAGGLDAIGAGDVATFRFKIGRATGPIAIRVENAKGVSADLKETDIGPSEGKILLK
jgi:hypothetical protein